MLGTSSRSRKMIKKKVIWIFLLLCSHFSTLVGTLKVWNGRSHSPVVTTTCNESNFFIAKWQRRTNHVQKRWSATEFTRIWSEVYSQDPISTGGRHQIEGRTLIESHWKVGASKQTLQTRMWILEAVNSVGHITDGCRWSHSDQSAHSVKYYWILFPLSCNHNHRGLITR